AFNWTYTLGVGLLDPWRHGATALIVAGDRPSAIWPGVIERARATIFAAVPSVHRQMLRDGDARAARFSSLRHALSAGETLRPVLLEAFTRTTGRPIFEAFGMSEISTYISSGPETPVKPGSPGRAQRGRRVATLTPEGRICDPGELGILAVHRSDPALFLNYFRDGEATQKAFCGDWFLTGDLASIDAQGYVWPQGRADDVMNAFGYRVAPEEVEAALSGHPGVQEIAVTSVPERDGVDLITAFVVPANPETFDPGVLLAYGEKVLARYKRPRKVVVLAHLPRTANGKVMRKRLIDETRF
ncbi:MAG: long-chain fatty acid--CoA ligase, partial [Hyphomicrobiaceae bacterium]|nr:long-chain fatty acid--CoA ligase [Hyphomicrobiaceae bacterium]